MQTIQGDFMSSVTNTNESGYLDMDALLAKTSEAITTRFSMVSVNETVTLYRGPITIEFGQGLKIANATLTWEWRRHPIILCCYSPTEQQRMTGNATDVFGKAHKVIFDDLGAWSWAAHAESHSCGGTRHQALKIVSPIVIGEILPAKKVKIHLVNCHDRSEEAVRTAGVGYDGSGRLRLMSNDWEILIDKVPEHDKLERHLNKHGGQAITHVAQVSRRDGTDFDVDAANEVQRHMRDFLAFATGSKPQICLASGFMDEDAPVWQIWESCAPSQWNPLSNWSTQPFVCGQVGRAFPQYLEKMFNVDWNEAISLSIDWYVQAKNRGLETALVLGQAALELLASTAFENASDKPCTEGEWDKWQASKRIRFLLETLGIDPALPPLLTKLSTFRFPDGKQFDDGPHALTALRNAIAHPKKKKRAQFGSQARELSHEATKMVLFFLEHALLVIIGFDGVANAEATHECLINYGLPLSPGA